MSFWENFWDIFWWFFLLYAFIAFLWALFAVIGDLFRDDMLSGWWKAVWILFLVFVPLLGVLVYGEPFSRTQLTGYAIVWTALIVFGVDGFLGGRVSVGSARTTADTCMCHAGVSP